MKARLYLLLFCLIAMFVPGVGNVSAVETSILKPANALRVYDIAAAELQKYYEQATGKKLPIVTEDPGKGDLIVIGSDAVNRFSRKAIENKWIGSFQLRTVADDYRLLSARDGQNGTRNFLFLVGGRGRATLYAVYHFLELRAGCVWFWDGDVVPKKDTIDITGLDITESPRFEYRGLRYFAHRGLTRFQAEHWGPKDWEREIDWICKKRLNMFMLRIGHDDIFQKAFPDIVSYPDPEKPLPEAIERSYDDRNLFWSLQYRGELRKHILSYAFDRDLMHPEDFGTMSHWYARTPVSFLKKIKPTFVPQYTSGYGEETGLVWDIREDKYLDLYFKLTETHVREYGRPELFHTIGIAERRCYRDRADNLEMKLYSYRRLLNKVHEKYPTAPVLLAGWDFYHSWSNDEMPLLIKELDPKNTIILDYTSDGDSDRNFTNWGVVGKFPYIFGIFEAFESSTDIRGDYPLIEKRISVAEPDPYCKGYIFWPECSHADIFMLDYFPANAWDPKQVSTEGLLEKFCKVRYNANADAMQKIWSEFLPISYVGNWHHYGERFFFQFVLSHRIWDKTTKNPNFWVPVRERYQPVIARAPEVFKMLAELPYDEKDMFLRRDAIDVARTTANHVMSWAYVRLYDAVNEWIAGRVSDAELRKLVNSVIPMAEAFRDLLALHDDYSLYASLERLKTIAPVNSNFEKTLLGNAANGYCRSYVYEFFDNYYIPTIQVFVSLVNERLDKKDKSQWLRPKDFLERQNKVYDTLYTKKLADMAPKATRTSEDFRRCMKTLAERSALIAK
ncbi:MAG: alpha-N-acetylglucosaminidase TIM-barrel domain-containing protein [Thermoguttaceae bacterium]|nr:alpha-N-acetylglucosaminidase TIM-barrel domain-containing protein [Thermoguttaceae bacterium]